MNKNGLQTHAKTRLHEEERVVFSCEACGKRSKQRLQAHTKTHQTRWKCSFSVNGIKLVIEVKEVKGILKYDGSVTFEELFCLKCGEEIKEVASLHHRIPVLPAHQSNDVALLEFVSYECTYCPAILNEEEMLAHKNCVKTVS